jgi:uncharacterized protein (TIGR02452 family)
VVELAAMLGACRRDSELVKETDGCWGHAVQDAERQFAATRMSIHDRTVLQELSALSAEIEPSKIMVLNFASAKNPGGGFLNGAQAQEESLARSGGGHARSVLDCSLICCVQGCTLVWSSFAAPCTTIISSSRDLQRACTHTE